MICKVFFEFLWHQPCLCNLWQNVSRPITACIGCMLFHYAQIPLSQLCTLRFVLGGMLPSDLRGRARQGQKVHTYDVLSESSSFYTSIHVWELRNVGFWGTLISQFFVCEHALDQHCSMRNKKFSCSFLTYESEIASFKICQQQRSRCSVSLSKVFTGSVFTRPHAGWPVGRFFEIYH